MREERDREYRQRGRGGSRGKGGEWKIKNSDE